MSLFLGDKVLARPLPHRRLLWDPTWQTVMPKEGQRLYLILLEKKRSVGDFLGGEGTGTGPPDSWGRGVFIENLLPRGEAE